MRLTLRTLLAYMDEILEPGDREELAKRIETSEFANNLILRTKDTTRRLRLSAPHVVGTGIGLDPNTVAEYLDNVLPPDSVADFERICLESDVHLAEAASCHHVLTMVLGEAAEVDPVARQRMYDIPAEAARRRQLHLDSAHPTAIAAPDPIAAPPQYVVPASKTAAPERRSTEIPDYLRASNWSFGRLALGALAAALLVGVGAIVLFGLNGWGSRELAGASGGGASSSIAPPTTAPSVADDAESAPAAADGDVVAELSDSPPPLMLPGQSEPLDLPPAQPPAESGLTDSVESELPPAAEADRYAVPDDGNVAGSVPEIEPPPLPPQPEDMTVATPPETATTPADETPRLARSDVTPDAGADAAADEDSTAEADEPPVPTELGTYLDGKNVLVRFDPAANAWYRLPPRSMIAPGDRLLALPAFHPKLTLTSGLHLKLAGGTLVTMSNGSNGAPVLEVSYGRVVIVNTTNGDNDLQLRVGGTDFDVQFLPSGTLAVEVVPSYIAGNDPRQAPSPTVVQLYARDGSLVWTDASGSRTIESPSQWTIVEGVASAPAAVDEFPEWIDHEPVEQRSEQLYGVPVVEQGLDPTRPVEEQLLELYQSSRRREVKSLVARGSVYVGQFVPFVEALRDSDQKATWKTHIETLRSAMSLGPESAERIYQTLVDQRGETAAAELYEMLCGYGPEQIGTPEEFSAGLGSQLVDWMENDSLDYRVLAVQDLWEITGMRLMPNPAGSPTERARGIRIWRERLKSGEVEPVTPAP